MEKIKKSTIIGEYIIEISENNSVKVYKIPKVAKAALRECAHKQGMEFSEEKETTQSLGWKLLRQYCDGASNGTIGEYHIERQDNGHIDVYVEHKNTIGALREVAKLLKGFVWEEKWNTQDAGRKIVSYAEQNPKCILAKAPTEKQEDEQTATPASETEDTSVLTIEQCKEMAEGAHRALKNDCWEDEQGVRYSKDRKRLLKGPEGHIEGEYAVLPGTLVICEFAFAWSSEFTKVILPEGLLYIGSRAFYCCGLESVEIPQSVLYIGDSAFRACRELSDIKMSGSPAIESLAFLGTPAYEKNPNVVETVIEISFKELKGKLSEDTISEMAEQIDEEDRNIETKLVAILDVNGGKKLVWSETDNGWDEADELDEDLLRNLLEKVNDYCEETLGISSKDVDFTVQYVAEMKDLAGFWWEVSEVFGGLRHALKNAVEEEYSCWGDSSYFEENDYLLNVFFRITWANGEKQNLFVGLGQEVYSDAHKVRFYRVAEPYKQLIKEICEENVPVGKPVPARSAIKNIIETTMKAYSDEIKEPAIGILALKYNPDNEDTILVATVDPEGEAKKMYFGNDPLWTLLEEARDEMDGYCEEEFGDSYVETGFKVEWPTKIKLHRGTANSCDMEATIIPYAVYPNEEVVEEYRAACEDEDEGEMERYGVICNSLVRIHWSNGEVQDLFIDEDLKVHDFNTMDKSQLPECDRKSFDELIKG